MNQNIISGYETITYYLHFAENPTRFGQVVMQKYDLFFIFYKLFHKTILGQVLTKCTITMHKNQFMLLLNNMKRKLLACFYPPLEVLCNTSFSVWSTDFLHSWFYSSYCISMSFIWVIFPKLKKLYMLINNKMQNCLFRKYVMIKSMLMVNYAHCYVITDPDICERCYLHEFTYLTGFYRLSGTTFVRKVCIQFKYVCKPVFCEHSQPVEATYSQVTKLGRRGPMTCFIKINISLWLLGQIRWGLHWIVEK